MEDPPLDTPLGGFGVSKPGPFEGPTSIERWFLFPTNLLGHYSSFRGPFRILATGQEVPSANFRGTCDYREQQKLGPGCGSQRCAAPWCPELPAPRCEARWPWLSKPLWLIPFWLVGEFTMLEPTLVGIRMFTGGAIWVLTHGQMLSRARRTGVQERLFRDEEGVLVLGANSVPFFGFPLWGALTKMRFVGGYLEKWFCQVP